MNVLLTSVGRRAYMVKFFKHALRPDGEVHAVNSDSRTIAFHYADKSAVSPIIYSDEYIPFLLSYCKDNKIDFIVSLFDIDLPVLAANRQKFESIGTRLIVSDSGIIDICNDKWKTYNYLKDNGFSTPRSFLSLEQVLQAIESGEVSYPIIVKPRFGCGSIALSVAEDHEDLLYYYSKNMRVVNNTYLKYESAVSDEKIIYQECLKGQEYGADIINDLDGNFKNVIIRKKIAMRAGETDIAQLVDNPAIRAELERLGRMTGHIANMDCDVFLVDDVPYILEMNARFGGGYPFSHMGGCDLPQAIVNWLENKPVPDEMLSSRTGITGFKELGVTRTE